MQNRKGQVNGDLGCLIPSIHTIQFRIILEMEITIAGRDPELQKGRHYMTLYDAGLDPLCILKSEQGFRN